MPSKNIAAAKLAEFFRKKEVNEAVGQLSTALENLQRNPRMRKLSELNVSERLPHGEALTYMTMEEVVDGKLAKLHGDDGVEPHTYLVNMHSNHMVSEWEQTLYDILVNVHRIDPQGKIATGVAGNYTVACDFIRQLIVETLREQLRAAPAQGERFCVKVITHRPNDDTHRGTTGCINDPLLVGVGTHRREGATPMVPKDAPNEDSLIREDFSTDYMRWFKVEVTPTEPPPLGLYWVPYQEHPDDEEPYEGFTNE